MAQVNEVVFGIDFEVNDAELKRIESQLDELAKSSQDFGNSTQGAFQRATKAVSNLEEELIRLERAQKEATDPAEIKRYLSEIDRLKQGLNGVANAGNDTAKATKALGLEINRLRALRSQALDPTLIRNLDAGIRQLEADLRKFNSTAAQTNVASRQASGGISNMVGSFSKSAIAFGATAFATQQLSNVLLDLGKKSIQSAIEFEQTRIALEVIAGSAENATLILRQIDALALKSPFDTAELERSAKAILSIGTEADKVVPTLQLLTDVAASGGKLTAEQLERTVRAFTQVQTKGKVSAEELNQFGDAGINVRDILAKELNLSLQELQKQLDLGRIPAQALTNAFITATSEGGKFAGLSEKLSQSTGGRLNTAIDTFNLTLRDLGTKVLPLVTAAVDFFGGAFAKLIRFYELGAQKVSDFLNANEGIKSGLQGVLDFITPVFTLFGKFFFDTPRQLFAVGSAFIGTFKDIGNAALALGDVLQALTTFNFEQIRFSFSKFTDQVANSLDVTTKYEDALKEFDATKPKEEIDKLTKGNADLLKSTAAGAKGQKDYAASIRDKTEAVKADTKAIEDATRAAIKASDTLNQETESIRNTAIGDDRGTEAENLENARRSSIEKNKLEAKFALENVAIRRKAAVDKLNADKENAVKEINEAKISIEAKNAALLALETQYNGELDRINKKSIADRAKTQQLNAAKSANETQKILIENGQKLFETQRDLDAQLLNLRLQELTRDAENTGALEEAVRLQTDATIAAIDKESERLNAARFKAQADTDVPEEIRTQNVGILTNQIRENEARRKEIIRKSEDEILQIRFDAIKTFNERALSALETRLAREKALSRQNLNLKDAVTGKGQGLREVFGLPQKKVKFEERDDIQLLNKEIENTKILYDEAVKSQGLFSTQATELLAKLNGFEAEKQAKKADQVIKDAREIVDAVVTLGNEVTNLINTIFDFEIAQANKAIEKQEQYIDTIKRSLEAGKEAYKEYTVAQLAAEEARLEGLKKQRERDARAQQALAVVQIATNLAIGISKAIAQGGIAGAITGAATLVAFAAGIIQAKQLAQSAAPSFGEGGIIQGKSHAAGGVDINAEGGEMVVNKVATRRYKSLLHDINDGKRIGIYDQSTRVIRGERDVKMLQNSPRQSVELAKMFLGLTAEVKDLKKSIQNQTLTSRTDGGDLAHVVTTRQKSKNRLDRLAG